MIEEVMVAFLVVVCAQAKVPECDWNSAPLLFARLSGRIAIEQSRLDYWNCMNASYTAQRGAAAGALAAVERRHGGSATIFDDWYGEWASARGDVRTAERMQKRASTRVSAVRERLGTLQQKANAAVPKAVERQRDINLVANDEIKGLFALWQVRVEGELLYMVDGTEVAIPPDASAIERFVHQGENLLIVLRLYDGRYETIYISYDKGAGGAMFRGTYDCDSAGREIHGG